MTDLSAIARLSAASLVPPEPADAPVSATCDAGDCEECDGEGCACECHPWVGAIVDEVEPEREW